MRRMKFLLHDLKNDIRSKYQYLIFGVLLALTTHISTYNRLVSAKMGENLKGNGSFADYWICMMQGKEEYHFSIGSTYEFPTNWFLLFIFVMIPICIYTWEDLGGYGQQLIVRAKSRTKWLYSKYIWAGMVVLLYFLLLLGMTLLFCLNENVVLSMHPTWYIMELHGSSTAVDLPVGRILALYFVQPFLLMVLFCYMEITLLLYIPPVISFFCSGVVLIISLYVKSYLLVGNWGIPIRMKEVTEKGLSGSLCICLMVLVIAVMTVIGTIRMNKKDIL